MPYAASIPSLAEFQQKLVGCWENRPFGEDKNGNPVGGVDNPLSYNIMPLPEAAAPNKYILKNFKYTERLKFNDDRSAETLAIAAIAPNRGGLVSQNCRALFYEQQVRFAEGPQGPGGGQAGDKAHGDVVHVENGAWLWLPRFVQQPGPFPANIDQNAVSDDLDQPFDIMIGKMMSVPHGNVILALGHFDTVGATDGKTKCERIAYPVIEGTPVIPDGASPYPRPADAVSESGGGIKSNLNACEVYSTEASTPANFMNPHPDLTRFPNRPIQQAVAMIEPERYIHWRVTTQPSANGHGQVINIPFEMRVSDVIGYSAEYWLMIKGKERYLAYTQTIPMKLTIDGIKYVFPHITCNTVTFCQTHAEESNERTHKPREKKK